MMNVTLKRPSLELAFEVGSLKELAGYIEQEGTELSKIFGDDMEMVVKAVSSGDGVGNAPPAANDEAPKGRGRPKKNQPDPATATAPPPAPVPGAAPAAPVDTTATNANGLPAFLDRTADAPPPPPPPPPPAPAPVVPPSGILAGKVIDNLDKRKAGTADGGKSLADWLASYKIVNPGSSYDESIAAVRLMADDKLAQVATALEIK